MQMLENTKNFVSKNIKRLRDLLGLTQSEFAERVGLSLSAIQRFEQGERVPRQSTLTQIAKSLGVYVDELVFDPENLSLSMVDNVSATAALKKIRDNKGITLEHISKETQVPLERLKLMEGNILQPSDSFVNMFLRVLGVKRSEFDQLKALERSQFLDEIPPSGAFNKDAAEGDYIAKPQTVADLTPAELVALLNNLNRDMNQITVADGSPSEKDHRTRLIAEITASLPSLEINHLEGLLANITRKLGAVKALKKASKL